MNYRNKFGLTASLVVAHLWMGASIAGAEDAVVGQNVTPPAVIAVLDAANLAVQKVDYSQAVAQYTKALEIDPKNALTWFSCGEAHRHLGQYEKALLDYKQAIQLDAVLVSRFTQGTGADKVRAENQSFLLSIEDAFSITGLGVAVTGQVARGGAKVGDVVEVAGLRSAQEVTPKATVIQLRVKQKPTERVVAGESGVFVLRGVERKAIERGQTLIAPGSVVPSSEFEAQIYLLPSEQGGRKTPFFPNYRPQFFLRTVNITGTVLEVGGEGGVAMPGEMVNIKANLIIPMVLEEGLRFALREGGRTIGVGVVTKIKPTITP